MAGMRPSLPRTAAGGERAGRWHDGPVRTGPDGASTGPPQPAPVPPARAGTEAITLPPPRDLGLLILALVGVSTSGPLIAATAAPALAIAFWRNALATGAVLPFALWRTRAELRGLGRRDRRLCVLSGTLLAGHFAAWVPSVTLTTVASSTALVSTQPVWAALIARAAGRRIGVRVWIGIGIAVAGAVLLTGADVALSGRALAGDLLAIGGGMLGAAYVPTGAAVRAGTSTTTYTAICYPTCALLLLAGCLASGQQLGGYDPETWVKLVALTAGAQLMGHSL